MFDGFALEEIDVGEAVLRVRHGGSGAPVLLLHGHPRTHTTWHRVAPLLVDAGHAVVCPDLRGYGASSKPETDADHEPYSKRAMARDCVALMRVLGHERFAVAGHDRGALRRLAARARPSRGGQRAGRDGRGPDRRSARALRRAFAESWWHWFFLGQTDKPAERVISADPEAWYRPNREAMGEENLADYLRAIHDPATVHAMCEDYRAGLGIDREHDEADREAGRRIACPMLLLWAIQDDMEALYGDPLEIWRPWAADLRGSRIDSGHHMAEEAPAALAAELAAFLHR